MKVFTGEVPFNRVKASEVVMLIIRGKRPERPNHPKFTSPFWTLTQMCWVDGAQDRPKMEDVARMLEELLVPNYFPFVQQTLTKAPAKRPIR